MSHLSTSVANFRLMREMLSGVGCFAWARARAVFRMDDAVKQDPRLPRRVGGGRRRLTTTDGTLGAGTTASLGAEGAGRF